MTYDTAYNFDDLFDNFLLADKIHNVIHITTVGLSRSIAHCIQIIRHEAEQIDPSSGNNFSSPLGWAPLTETLKLTFNLTSLYPHRISAFNSTLNPILAILKSLQTQTPILQPPLTQLINVLLNLNLLGKESESAHEHGNNLSFFPNSGPNTHVSRLVAILDSAIRTTSEEILESAAIPLITLLRRAYDLAPSSVKTYMQSTLLPSNDERTQPLGRSDTLASCLLRLSTSAVAPNLREGISSLLFELSDKEATSFVRNVGYGFAAGFLMTHNLPIPDNALKSDDERGSLGGRLTNIDGKEINPVTGQRRDMEPENLGPEMTEEEKEVEAERLFVLFERLKATGVVNVVNPVQQAVQEGRVEELD